AAHQPNRELIAATFDHLLPQDDPLAKNVAASLKKSRSFFTRASSRLRRASSSSRGVPVPPKATLPWLSASRFQRVSSVSRIPSSRATWAQLTPGWLACSTAPRLNSALNFLRFDMNTPGGPIGLLASVRENGGEPQEAASQRARAEAIQEQLTSLQHLPAALEAVLQQAARRPRPSGAKKPSVSSRKTTGSPNGNRTRDTP